MERYIALPPQKRNRGEGAAVRATPSPAPLLQRLDHAHVADGAVAEHAHGFLIGR